jgi:hypothetical protein
MTSHEFSARAGMVRLVVIYEFRTNLYDFLPTVEAEAKSHTKLHP